MQTIKASEFKARCLQLMDEVNEKNEEFVITKNGKPVSKLVPYRKKVDSLFGILKGQLEFRDDLIDPVEASRDAEK